MSVRARGLAPPVPQGRHTTARSGIVRRDDIQGLRAVAVILVIGNHAGVPGFGGGFVGVDVFFVVSGFVITNLLLREKAVGLGAGLADFYCRRIRRIVPAASIVLIATSVASVVALPSRTDPRLFTDVRWASLFAANVRLISTGSGYFVQGTHPSLVTQFWSLAVEEQFYLVFPVVFFAVSRVTRPHEFRRILSIMLVSMVGASLVWCIATTSGGSISAYYSPLTRFWELGSGCLLAVATSGHPTRTARSEYLATLLGLALGGMALVGIDAGTPYPGWHALLPCGAAVLLVWAGVGGVRTPVTAVLADRRPGRIGDMSYSLYLVHFPLIELGRQLPMPLSGWRWYVIVVGVTGLVAAPVYRFIENPIRNSRRLAEDRVATALLLVVCVAATWTVADALAGAAGVA